MVAELFKGLHFSEQANQKCVSFKQRNMLRNAEILNQSWSWEKSHAVMHEKMKSLMLEKSKSYTLFSMLLN